MCTAITYQTSEFYFGRTLDYEIVFGETVTVTPRRFPLVFRHVSRLDEHYAIIGMAHVANEYPLYYDAVNETGLCIAGLNFVGNACYGTPKPDCDNIAQFELIPWLLGTCASVEEARKKLEILHVVNTPFSPRYPTAQLHWILADKTACITVESVAEGLRVYDNPVGVLTNNPPFDEQLQHLRKFSELSNEEPPRAAGDERTFSRGGGALGLPGDLTSQSRFVRAAFTRRYAVSEPTEEASVSEFFHILGTVEQTRGCCDLGGQYEITQYTSCCNADRGIYYYTTYDNRQITAVDMHRESLDDTRLISYPLIAEQQIRQQN